MLLKRLLLRFCTFVAISAMALCALMPGSPDPLDEEFEGQMDAALAAAMNETPFYMPPVTDVESKPSCESRLGPKERVLGVVVDGRPRAYSLARLSGVADHVICDSVENSRIAVTWCDQSECARVFQLSADDVVSVAGFMAGEMHVLYNGQRYSQSSDQIPLAEIECSVIPWGEWQARHCDTLIVEYEG